MKSYKSGGYTFQVGDKIKYQRFSKSITSDFNIIYNIRNNGVGPMRLYYTNDGYDFVYSVVESLDKGEMLLIPARKSKKKSKTTCECKELKLQIATIQKKNDELTDALTNLAEQAMNAAGWKMKVNFVEKETKETYEN